ncbi:MAG: tRNA-dihydrouridine synthase [Patescibacteria group bacterium]
MTNFWTKLPKPILALAPMAGVTDFAFRQMCKSYGADVIYTEFASANALVYENAKTKDMIKFAPTEQPVVCQIFGNQPEMFFKAAKILEEMGFAGVDINFGCPAYKVVKTGGGVSLMRNLNLCYEIVQATCEAVKIPVSIKIRASIRHNQDTKDKIETDDSERHCEDEARRRGRGNLAINSLNVRSPRSSADSLAMTNCDTVTAVDLVNKIGKLPVGAIMIHARSFEQPFDGEPKLEILSEVRKVWAGILIANGGIYTPEKAKEILETTGVDGIGLARGAWGHPWLFKQIRDYLKTGEYQTPVWNEIKKDIIKHAQLAFENSGTHGLIELRKHLGWYVKGFSNASEIRGILMKTKTLDEIKSVLGKI